MYYKNNKDFCIKRVKNYSANNREKILKHKKQYYIENKDKKQNYQFKNKEKFSKIQNEKRKERRKNDPAFRLRIYISNHIRDALKRNKNNESTWSNLPYTPQELKNHLESLFEPWMTWNNHGNYNSKTWDDNDQSTWTWQIDHIIPHSNFCYFSMKDVDFFECWKLSNIRPLAAKQNIVDGSTLIRHK